MSRVLLSTLLVLLATGCYRLRIKDSRLVPEDGPARERWVHGFVGNSLQWDAPIEVDTLCPRGVAYLEHEVSGLNALITALTGIPVSAAGLAAGPAGTVPAYYLVGRHISFWTPTTLRFQCAAGAVAGRKLALMQFVARGEVDASLAEQLWEALAGELRRTPGVSVLTEGDIAAALGHERLRQLLGCTDEACLSEIGGALGVDRVLHGSLGKVGDSYLFNVAAVDPGTARVAASASERISAGPEALLDALPGIARKLLAEPAPASP